MKTIQEQVADQHAAHLAGALHAAECDRDLFREKAASFAQAAEAANERYEKLLAFSRS